jgi:hypothetical protein
MLAARPFLAHMSAWGIESPPIPEARLTPSDQPPRTPREEEEFLDWSENQARPARHLLRLDAGLMILLLILSLLLILGVVAYLRGWHW